LVRFGAALGLLATAVCTLEVIVWLSTVRTELVDAERAAAPVLRDICVVMRDLPPQEEHAINGS
jgi:hypothetical protein